MLFFHITDHKRQFFLSRDEYFERSMQNRIVESMPPIHENQIMELVRIVSQERLQPRTPEQIVHDS